MSSYTHWRWNGLRRAFDRFTDGVVLGMVLGALILLLASIAGWWTVAVVLAIVWVVRREGGEARAGGAAETRNSKLETRNSDPHTILGPGGNYTREFWD